MQAILLAVSASAFTLRWSGTALLARAGEVVMSVTEEYACRQRAAYFKLMPSKELPKVSLDLRAWASTADDNFEAGVFARQEGTVNEWVNIGAVATADAAAFSQAVAKQRELISRWAIEVCNDFETNALLMDPDRPVELAWAIEPKKPSLFDSVFAQKKPGAERAQFVEVAPDCNVDDELRCGFLGRLSREYRGGGVSARYERIVIGQAPEVPVRHPAQEKYNSKYAGGKGGGMGLDGTGSYIAPWEVKREVGTT
jgi:hypothetical protein